MDNKPVKENPEAMRRTHPDHTLNRGKTLEITMQDVLESLQDSAAWLGFCPGLDNMQILSIEATTGDILGNGARASVHRINPSRSAGALEFLLARESRR